MPLLEILDGLLYKRFQLGDILISEYNDRFEILENHDVFVTLQNGKEMILCLSIFYRDTIL